jgi:hypothetical protein
MPEVCLPLDLPEDLSDEAVAQLVECLYAIAGSLENCYFGQLRRHYQARCGDVEAVPEIDPRQRWLWPELEREF